VFRVVPACGRQAAPRLRDQEDDLGAGFAAAGESWAVAGWLCFGGDEMVGYTSRPVGGLGGLAGGVRDAFCAREAGLAA
jgi:hypothetical protein